MKFNSILKNKYEAKDINCIELCNYFNELGEISQLKSTVLDDIPITHLLFLKCAIEHYKYINKDKLDLISFKYYYIYNIIIVRLIKEDLSNIKLDANYLLFLNSIPKDFLILNFDNFYSIGDWFTSTTDVDEINDVYFLNRSFDTIDVVKLLYCNQLFNNKFNKYNFNYDKKIYLKNFLNKFDNCANIYCKIDPKNINTLIITTPIIKGKNFEHELNLQLTLIKVIGDGSCLYHSIITLIYFNKIRLPKEIQLLFDKYPIKFEEMFNGNPEIQTFDPNVAPRNATSSYINSTRYKLIKELKNKIISVLESEKVYIKDFDSTKKRILDMFKDADELEIKWLSYILNICIATIYTFDHKIYITIYGEKYSNIIFLHNTGNGTHFNPIYDYSFV